MVPITALYNPIFEHRSPKDKAYSVPFELTQPQQINFVAARTLSNCIVLRTNHSKHPEYAFVFERTQKPSRGLSTTGAQFAPFSFREIREPDDKLHIVVWPDRVTDLKLVGSSVTWSDQAIEAVPIYVRQKSSDSYLVKR